MTKIGIRRTFGILAVLAVAGAAVAAFAFPHRAEDAPTPVRWRKTVIDPMFRSEGVAVADVNRDGKTDVIVGDYWYEAPNWQRHEIRPPLTNLGNGDGTYSEAFCCFAGDFNKDGWPDVLVIPFPGKAAVWYENPGKAIMTETRWKSHPVAPSSCNETPIYVELFGGREKYLVMATQPEGQMCWFSPAKDPDKPWDRHPISVASTKDAKVPGTEVFSHGLGSGDVNSDGRTDILIRQGWWEQPKDARKTDGPWTFHPANLGDDCANMHAFDMNGDKLPDVVSSSAHNRGIWWYEQQKDGTFTRQVIEDRFTQSHAMNLVDINGDGRKDFVTGKRWWAHGSHGDVDPNAAPVLYWFEVQPQKNAPPRFLAHLIDDGSGIGTQFATEDVNGDKRPDVIVSNKRGVFLFEQMR
jgi:hypothetical protein